MKSVLITGCSSGIGLCIAKGLKEKGYRVFASARSSDDVKNLQNLGFESLLLDLASSESINDAVIKLFEILKPKKMILTNLHSDLDYDYLIKVLPKNIMPGYDGLTLTI